jgi:hypothetical protein
MKTVLAPGAPWPNPVVEKPKVVKVKKTERSCRKKTDALFDLWAAKNLKPLH